MELGFDASDHIPDSGHISVFLHSKGYYEHKRDFSGVANYYELFKFREPGYFSQFSQDEYNRLLERSEAISFSDN